MANEEKRLQELLDSGATHDELRQQFNGGSWPAEQVLMLVDGRVHIMSARDAGTVTWPDGASVEFLT